VSEKILRKSEVAVGKPGKSGQRRTKRKDIVSGNKKRLSDRGGAGRGGMIDLGEAQETEEKFCGAEKDNCLERESNLLKIISATAFSMQQQILQRHRKKRTIRLRWLPGDGR